MMMMMMMIWSTSSLSNSPPAASILASAFLKTESRSRAEARQASHLDIVMSRIHNQRARSWEIK